MSDVEIVRGIAQPLTGSPDDLRGVVGTNRRRADRAVGRSISRHARILLRARGNHETRAVEPLERISIWDERELHP